MRRAIVVLTLGLALLSGCWDRREIEERSNLLAVGIDACPPEAGCKVMATRQIAIPGRIPLGATTEGGGSSDQDTVAILSTTGEDATQTLDRLQAKLNHKVTIAHLRTLLFSEEFARGRMGTYLDMIRRMPETRRLQWLAVVDGKAEEVIRARPSLEQVPALFLSDMVDDAVNTGRLPASHLGDFLVRLASKGEEPVLPLLKMAGPDRVALAGLAVFRDDKMVGKLDPEETTAFLQLSGIRRGSDLIRLTLKDGRQADLMVYERAARYHLEAPGRRIRVRIVVQLEADLFRLSTGLDPQNPAHVSELERLAAKQVREKTTALVRRLQGEWQSDILGVGERVRAYLPSVWATIPSWPAAFARAEIEIDAQVRTRRSGLSAR